jgi:glutathione S-transferase
MRLIGMLDSPYVRRTAISMKLMGLPFDQEAISVFRQYGAFADINPVVKAPTLVLDDGTVLMDSTLILEHLELLAPFERRLTPTDVRLRARALRITGLALAACEKTVQLVYERELRPAEKQHQPWVDRVRGQLRAACLLLEGEFATVDWLFGRPQQADVTAAVAWRFIQESVPETVEQDRHPALVHFGARAEALPEFQSTPFGEAKSDPAAQ